MSVTEDREFVGHLLDTYAANAWRRGVASSEPDRGVPRGMQVGEVDAEGWVDWRILPSTLDETNVTVLETEFGVRLPPTFRAYLIARFHLFDQVQSRHYDQSIIMTDTPLGRPLEPLRGLMKSWRPLIDAGFVPFAQWGDGWGPICFDVRKKRADGECPVVWMDHEAIIAFGTAGCRNRELLLSLVRPLHASCREFLIDVFGRADHVSS